MERWRHLARRIVGGSWLVLVPACEVDTNVAGAPEDPLPGMEPWCEERCGALWNCEIDDEPAGCVKRCVEYFADVSEGGAACEGASDRLMDCVERHACGELVVDDWCRLTNEEMDCATADGRTLCDSPFSAGNAGGLELFCDVGFSECSDGREYALTCSGPSDQAECHCTVDGAVVGRFSPSLGSCPDNAEAIQICGWPMGEDAAELWSPLPVTCEIHTASVNESRGLVTGCDIWFDDCSDDNYYQVLCGVDGAADCTCTINGEAVGTSPPISAVCPFALDPDGGAATLNYLCGVGIAPPEDQP